MFTGLKKFTERKLGHILELLLWNMASSLQTHSSSPPFPEGQDFVEELHDGETEPANERILNLNLEMAASAAGHKPYFQQTYLLDFLKHCQEEFVDWDSVDFSEVVLGNFDGLEAAPAQGEAPHSPK